MEPQLSSRFLQALERLTKATPDARIGLAVSGGPDSMALLMLAHQAIPERIAATTVDHGLRPEATDEAAFVAQICAERSIVHSILRPAAPISGNIQSSARDARYTLLEEWRTENHLDYIATAHHGDDQLETILMRLARGSGVDGLASIRERNGWIIRPLLGFTKAELVQICADSGISPVADPSNNDTDFDRVRMRKWLADADMPVTTERAHRSAIALSEASDALKWITAKLASERLDHAADGKLTLDTSDLPAELKRRLLIQAVGMLDEGAAPRGDSIEHAIAQLQAYTAVSIGNCVASSARKSPDIWTIERAPPRR